MATSKEQGAKPRCPEQKESTAHAPGTVPHQRGVQTAKASPAACCLDAPLPPLQGRSRLIPAPRPNPAPHPATGTPRKPHQISCLGFHPFLFLAEGQEPWLATFLSLNWSCQNNTLDFHVSENLLQNIKIYTPTKQMCIILYLSHIFHETHMVYYCISNI